MTLVFTYVARGVGFDVKLNRSLEKELACAVRTPPRIITCPTPPHLWFADPIWAIAPAKD